MGKFVGKWILLVIILLVALPISLGYVGNSSSYDVVITQISSLSFEETTFKTIGLDTLFNTSLEGNIDQMPVEKGDSLVGMYEVLPGISRLLGSETYEINITAYDESYTVVIPYTNSIINCSGEDIFSVHNDTTKYYRYTSSWGGFTDWNESGILNCTSFGCEEGNLTCHFMANDGVLNSTEINETIYINSSKCGIINTSVILLNDVTSAGTCFTIGANNITLDCAGYKIDYSTSSLGYGINNTGYNNTIVKNCIINQTRTDGNAYGIMLLNANNNSFMNNNITTNNSIASYLTTSSNNTFMQNNISSNTNYGNYLFSASNNTFMQNSITSNTNISNYVYSSPFNIFINNTIVSNTNYGNMLSSSNNTFINNSIITYASANAQANQISSGSYNNFIGNNISAPFYQANAIYGSYNNFTGNILNSNHLANTLSSTTGNIFKENNIYSNIQVNIYLIGGSKNIFISNNLSGDRGFYVYSNSNNNTFIKNNINTTGHAIAFLSSSYNNFTENSIISTLLYGIDLEDSSHNNTFINCNISGGPLSNNIFLAYGSFDNYFINSTFNKTKVNITNGSIFVQWYLDIHAANSTGQDLENATVTGYNRTSNFIFEENTTSTGWINTQTLTEYMENSSGKYYQTNYTISAREERHKTKWTQLNLTQSTILYLMLDPQYLPVVNSTRIYSSSNTSADDLIGYCNATDLNDDRLIYYYIWYKNGVINTTGVTSINYTQGVEVNVANISKNYLKVDDNWTLSCLAYDEQDNSTEWKNSTTLKINQLPTITLISPINQSVWNQSLTIMYEYIVNDTDAIDYCELNIDGIAVKNSSVIQKEIIQNFTYFSDFAGIKEWNVTCVDESGGKNTSQTWNVNKTTEENFYLSNIGATGFENTNQEYTYTKLVIINNILSTTSSYCRYKNEDGAFLNNWENCTLTKEWFLSDYDGLKNVTIQINHSGIDEGIITNYSDTIILQSNGSNLDVTPPQDFNVADAGAYTKKNTSFSASWDMPYDIETIMTNGKITFNYQLYDNTTGVNITGWIYTENLEAEILNLSLLENYTYILIVNATNSAGHMTQAESDGITIDLTAPNMTGIQSTISNSSWTRINNVTFNFTANDTLSGVKGFTMIFDNFEDTNISDNLKETELFNVTYENLDDGRYYFHIKSYDNADNFGETLTYNYSINIDTTPPTRPIIDNPTKYADNSSISFEWSPSIDVTSGFDYYNITIINSNTSVNYSAKINETKYTYNSATIGNNYYAIISAYDKAGNFIESFFDYNKTPIRIESASPNNTIVENNPIIKVWTSKEGICFADGNKFLYTNSRYHEIKLEKNDGAETTDIVCEDNLGYKDSLDINYNVSKGVSNVISIGTILTGYVSKTITVPFNISSIGQINKEDLEIYINDSEIDDFSVDSIDNKGSYELKFTINEKGNYNVKIKLGINQDTESFSVQSKTLTLSHSDMNVDNEQTKIIFSNYGNKTFGVGTDADIISKSSSGDKINITIDNNGKAYIFFTKKGINPKVKNEELGKKTFDDSLNSFGYQKNNDYIIGSTIIYDYITLSGLNYITPGSYNIFIKNLGMEDDKTTISIEIE